MSYAPEPDPPPLIPPGWRPRFTLRKILLLTTVLCVLFAVWQGLLRAQSGEGLAGFEAKFWVIAVVMLPMLVMIVLGLIGPAQRLWGKIRGRR